MAMYLLLDRSLSCPKDPFIIDQSPLIVTGQQAVTMEGRLTHGPWQTSSCLHHDPSSISTPITHHQLILNIRDRGHEAYTRVVCLDPIEIKNVVPTSFRGFHPFLFACPPQKKPTPPLASAPRGLQLRVSE